MSENVKEYSVSVYYKQGFDLRDHLEGCNYDAGVAFASWAEDLKYGYEKCMRLAKALKGKDITVFADCNHISLEPGNAHAEGLLEMLVKEGDVNVYNIDYDDGDLADDHLSDLATD